MSGWRRETLTRGQGGGGGGGGRGGGKGGVSKEMEVKGKEVEEGYVDFGN